MMVSGTVVDSETHSPLGDVKVNLYVFRQTNIFKMGNFSFESSFTTLPDGKFQFSIDGGKGKTIQLTTQDLGEARQNNAIVLRKVGEDVLDIKLEHQIDKWKKEKN
jgi:hypothetical protein